MADDEIRARFTLDAQEAADKLVKIKESISSIGASDNLTGLVSGLTKVGAVAGIVGATFLAFKQSFETILEAEKVKSINAQFEILTRSAGIATDTLRQGLEDSAKGLVTETELLESANKAILIMGSSADKLPEILELARKSAILFGKDTNDQFNDMIRAVETGSQRMLRHVGLTIDVAEATKKYAQSIGVSVAELSEAGKKQAILNAVLEQGRKSFGAVSESSLGVTQEWKKLKTSTSELYESFILVFEKGFGPVFKAFLEASNAAAKGIKNFFGLEPPPNLKAAIIEVAERMKALKKLIDAPREDRGEGRNSNRSGTNKEEFALQYEAESAKLKELKAQDAALDDAAKDSSRKKKFTNDELVLKAHSEFLARQLAMRKESQKLEEETIQDESKIDQLSDESDLILEDEFLAKKAAIRLQYADGDKRRNDLLELAESEHLLKIEKLELESAAAIEALKIASIENQIKASDDGFKKIALGLELSTRKAGIEFNKFEKVGIAASAGLSNGITSAFSHIADGSFDLARDMKKALLGALADEAEARGALLIASSIWPPEQWPGLAAGAGLVALGGTLRSLAGGGGSSVSAGGSSGGGGGATNYNPSQFGPSTDNRQALTASQDAAARKSVSITIQGNYFETEQTRQRLVEIIRDSADYSDFKVQSVGGGL